MSYQNPGLAEVAERRKKIAADLERLRSEDFDLETAERVLQKLRAAAVFADVVVVPVARQSRPPSTTEYMLKVLQDSFSPWMTTDEVQAEASKLAEREIPMGTVGPTLSNLKKEGHVARDGNKVALSSRVSQSDNFQKEESPSADEVDELS